MQMFALKKWLFELYTHITQGYFTLALTLTGQSYLSAREVTVKVMSKTGLHQITRKQSDVYKW